MVESNSGQLCLKLCLLLNFTAVPVRCHRQQIAHPSQNNCQSSTRHIDGKRDLWQLRIVPLGQNSQQSRLQGLDNVGQEQQADEGQHQRAPQGIDELLRAGQGAVALKTCGTCMLHHMFTIVSDSSDWLTVVGVQHVRGCLAGRTSSSGLRALCHRRT